MSVTANIQSFRNRRSKITAVKSHAMPCQRGVAGAPNVQRLLPRIGFVPEERKTAISCTGILHWRLEANSPRSGNGARAIPGTVTVLCLCKWPNRNLAIPLLLEQSSAVCRKPRLVSGLHLNHRFLHRRHRINGCDHDLLGSVEIKLTV